MIWGPLRRGRCPSRGDVSPVIRAFWEQASKASEPPRDAGTRHQLAGDAGSPARVSDGRSPSAISAQSVPCRFRDFEAADAVMDCGDHVRIMGPAGSFAYDPASEFVMPTTATGRGA